MQSPVQISELLFETRRGVLQERPVYLFLGRTVTVVLRPQVQFPQRWRRRLFAQSQVQAD